MVVKFKIYGNLRLRGENTVIGVADTGIGENNFFIDPVNGKVPGSSENAPYTNKLFRKVVQYVNFSGCGGDYNDGQWFACRWHFGWCEIQILLNY